MTTEVEGMPRDPQPRNPREALVERLAYMHRLLQWIDDRWQAKAGVARRYEPTLAFKRKWRVLAFLLWTVCLVIVLTIICTPIIQAWVQAEAHAQGQLFYPNIDAISVAIFAFPVAIVLAIVAVVIRNSVFLPRHRNRIIRINEQHERENSLVYAEEQQIDSQLQRAGRDFAQHVGAEFFPEAYRYEEAVVFCIQMVQNHRANSVKEAINLYELVLHQRRMENFQTEQLAEAQRARKLQGLGLVVNAAMSGAAIGTMRAEGHATRAANAANARGVQEALKQPVTVHVKKRGGIL